eukprot:396569_1
MADTNTEKTQTIIVSYQNKSVAMVFNNLNMISLQRKCSERFHVSPELDNVSVSFYYKRDDVVVVLENSEDLYLMNSNRIWYTVDTGHEERKDHSDIEMHPKRCDCNALLLRIWLTCIVFNIIIGCFVVITTANKDEGALFIIVLSNLSTSTVGIFEPIYLHNLTESIQIMSKTRHQVPDESSSRKESKESKDSDVREQ